MSYQQDTLGRLITEVNKLIDRRDKNESKMKMAMEQGRIKQAVRNTRQNLSDASKGNVTPLSGGYHGAQEAREEGTEQLDNNIMTNLQYMNQNEPAESSNIQMMLALGNRHGTSQQAGKKFTPFGQGGGADQSPKQGN